MMNSDGALDYEASLDQDERIDLRLWLRLLTCSTMIERKVRAGLRREFNTTLPRFDVLSQLDRAADGLTMRTLSHHLMVSPGNLTGLVERLAGEGLLSKQSDPNDRRSFLIRITTRGKAFFDRMTPANHAWVSGSLADLSIEEKMTLFDALGRLKQSAGRAQST